jgi:hypothetical protein
MGVGAPLFPLRTAPGRGGLRTGSGPVLECRHRRVRLNDVRIARTRRDVVSGRNSEGTNKGQ